MTYLIAITLWFITIGVLAITIVIQRRRVPHAQGSRRRQDELLPEFGDHDRLQASLAALKTHPGDVEIGPRLGHGTFGQVYKGRWKGANVAVKVILHQGAGYSSNLAVAREKMIGLASLHPNVVVIYAVTTEEVLGDGANNKGAYNLRTSIIMELCDKGTLLQLRSKLWEVLDQNYTSGLCRILRSLMEILFGMEYLHSVGIVHGDLKCANVLCFSRRSDARGFVCKVSDFGLSRSREGIDELFSSSPGTALFAAPELLSRGIGGFESDVYAFGILAWHLVSMGSSEADLQDIQVRYQVCERGWRPAFPVETPGAFKDLISRCWCKESSSRPSFTALRRLLTALLVETQHSLS